MKIKSISPIILAFSLACLASLSVGQTARAERVCEVTDPTGTPLNVREYPNGTVINALRNGREVYIHDTSNDGRWVRVGGYYNGSYRMWGWVFREYISCYDR